MSSSFSLLHIPKALPSLSPSHQIQCRIHLPSSSCQLKESHSKKLLQACTSVQDFGTDVLGLAVRVGGVLAIVAGPALAETGEMEGEDLIWILTQSGIAAFFYFLVVPPFLMNWLRTRWYKRNLLEMYVQFMFVFLFFPGVLLWAPFLNFRKFPRDPSMKYPWSVPENPSEIKGGYLKFPWAKPEDYDLFT
ncbi:hypothetical protein ACP275_12G066200 [Erythranthe tilingii]